VVVMVGVRLVDGAVQENPLGTVWMEASGNPSLFNDPPSLFNDPPSLFVTSALP
jgi:hypothetical protein